MSITHKTMDELAMIWSKFGIRGSLIKNVSHSSWIGNKTKMMDSSAMILVYCFILSEMVTRGH